MAHDRRSAVIEFVGFLLLVFLWFGLLIILIHTLV